MADVGGASKRRERLDSDSSLDSADSNTYNGQIKLTSPVDRVDDRIKSPTSGTDLNDAHPSLADHLKLLQQHQAQQHQQQGGVGPNVTLGHAALHHPHLLPYLYPHGLYSNAAATGLHLSQLLMPGAANQSSLSSGPHSLPLSLLASSPGHVGHLAHSHAATAAGLAVGHNLIFNAQFAFAAGHPLFPHGYSGLGAAGLNSAAAASLAASNAAAVAAASVSNPMLSSRMKQQRFTPYTLPPTNSIMTSSVSPLSGAALGSGGSVMGGGVTSSPGSTGDLVSSPLGALPTIPTVFDSLNGTLHGGSGGSVTHGGHSPRDLKPSSMSSPLSDSSSAGSPCGGGVVGGVGGINVLSSSSSSSRPTTAPSSVAAALASASELKSIENMVNGLERQQEQLAAESLTKLGDK